jgi:cyclohexanone monooxygenase
MARVLVLATGILEDPRVPPVPGLSEFPGRVFHSSRWPADYDPTGERIALVGTGASAIQILPEIAPKVARITLFQRTPAWVLPKPDWTHSTAIRTLVRRLPGAQRLLRALQWAGAEVFLAALRSVKLSNLIARLAKWNIRRAILDPTARAALTPGYVLGCKRALLSNTFYPALARPNVDLAATALAEVRGNTLVGADGSIAEVDTVILGTGFHVVDAPIYAAIRGRDGLSLADRWKGSPRAYKGITMSGCPNAFILWGPNGSSASVFTAVEASLGYLGAALRTMRAERLWTVEVREQAETAWKDMANRYAAKSVHNIGGCQTYYVDRNGDNLTLFPASMIGMKRGLRTFDLEAYHVTGEEA